MDLDPHVFGSLFHVRVRGKWACFTLPGMRTQRVSNVVGSSSAWSGLLSQILSKAGVLYNIERVSLLFYPRWMSMVCNEVKDFGNGTERIDVESCRTLRTTSLLVGNSRRVSRMTAFGEKIEETVAGVDYILSFRISTPKSLAGELNKFEGMFLRRLRNGRYWGDQCYLGIREYPATVEQVTDFSSVAYPEGMQLVEHPSGLKTADYNSQLGLCFYGTDWDDKKKPVNYFTNLEVSQGVVEYPSWQAVRKEGIQMNLSLKHARTGVGTWK